MKSKVFLNAIVFLFRHEEGGENFDKEGARSLMEELQPHPSLRYLEVKKYHGVRMPDWVTLLPNLVELDLAHCRELEYLPCLGNLRNLKVLKLIMLPNLEYIGEDSPSANTSSTPISGLLCPEGLSYYASLETLELSSLPKLKKWRRWVGDDHRDQLLHGGSSKAQLQLLPCFSQLKSLFIWNCPELTCIPLCPMVEDLKLINFNRRLRITNSTVWDKKLGEVASSSASVSASCDGVDNPKSCSIGGYIQHGMGNIKKLATSNVAWLNSLPMEACRCIESLDIWCDKEVESLGEVQRVFHNCSSSMRFLIIHNCCKLRSVVSGGLEHLTALEELQLRNCENLRMSEEEDEEREYGVDIGIIQWSSLHHSLHTLILQGLPQLVNLPNWMEFLPALQFLSISLCKQLKAMPKWMSKLTSLSELKVYGCSAKLERRCQKDPAEEDWPYIQHIPHIQFQHCVFKEFSGLPAVSNQVS